MTADPETIPLLVTLGHVGDGTLNLRFPPEYTDEILGLLDEHGIEHGTILEFSAGTELAIEAVKVLGALAPAGALAALASIIRTFVHMHDGKAVRLDDGEVVEVKGFSPKKTEQFLKKKAAEQAAQDAKWDRIRNQGRNEGGS